MKSLLFTVFALCSSATLVVAQPLKKGEVAQKRTQLWQQWQHALQQSASPLRMLSAKSLPSLQHPAEGSLTIPETLERDAVMPYYIGVKGDRPMRGYPLFLYLHGSGPADQEWTTSLAWAQRFDDAPSMYVIPRMPRPEGDWYRWYQQSKQWAWEQMLQYALASSQVDPDRLYVMGISEGGYGSQRLAAFYADYWAGAGPMAGGEPLQNAPAENCQHVAFSLLTGSEDEGFGRNLITKEALRTFDSLQNAFPHDFVHRIALQPGRGHGIDYTPTTTWLKSFRRNARPKEFLWENFPMGGRYRQGFYNLRVDSLPRMADVSPLSPGTTNDYDGRSPRFFHHLRIEHNEVWLNVHEVHYSVVKREPNWGIPVQFVRTFTPATQGRYTLFFDDSLVDLDRPVTIWVNGKRVFRGKLQRDAKHLRESLELFHDPQRLFPAAVQIRL